MKREGSEKYDDLDSWHRSLITVFLADPQLFIGLVALFVTQSFMGQKGVTKNVIQQKCHKNW